MIDFHRKTRRPGVTLRKQAGAVLNQGLDDHHHLHRRSGRHVERHRFPEEAAEEQVRSRLTAEGPSGGVRVFGWTAALLLVARVSWAPGRWRCWRASSCLRPAAHLRATGTGPDTWQRDSPHKNSHDCRNTRTMKMPKNIWKLCPDVGPMKYYLG